MMAKRLRFLTQLTWQRDPSMASKGGENESVVRVEKV